MGSWLRQITPRRLVGALMRPWRRRAEDVRYRRMQDARWKAFRYVTSAEACAEAEVALGRGDLAAAEASLYRSRVYDASHPRRPDISARYHLALGERETSAAILQNERRLNPRSRLLLNLLRCQLGEKALAHLDLSDWCRERRCPSSARVALAGLEMDAGRANAARRALGAEKQVFGPDARTCQMQVLIELTENLPEATRRSAGYLAHAFDHDGPVGRWLATLDLGPGKISLQAPIEMVDQLAGELLEKPETIATLVAAQKFKPKADRVELLRRALGRVVEDLPEVMTGYQALAELSLLAGDAEDACRWARRGLKRQPYSARLALILQEAAGKGGVDEAPVELRLRPVDALQRAVAANPGYPDLKRALILEFHREGMSALALDRARQWQEEEPDQALAGQTIKELAA